MLNKVKNRCNINRGDYYEYNRKRISEYRKKKNLKQDELAEKLGVSPQAVSKWENDLSCPDISLLPSLSNILGISIDELVQGKKDDPVVTVLPEEERRDAELAHAEDAREDLGNLGDQPRRPCADEGKIIE